MAGRLLIFCGIPGSGKTTIARLVAKGRPGTVHVQTDVVRGMIAKPDYTAAESELVYRTCIAIAREALDREYLVIIDGTFGSERRRTSTLAALDTHYSRADFVHVVCDLETALIRNGERDAAVPPDRVKGIYQAFDPIPGAFVVNSSTTAPVAAAEMVVRGLL